MSNDFTYIGHCHGWGSENILESRLSIEDSMSMSLAKQDRQVHASPKSDRAAHGGGHGVGLIDPHGDLAEELLNHIPTHRTRHLVYFNPADLNFPVGLNPLDVHRPGSTSRRCFRNCCRIQKHLARFMGARMEYILYNALAALLDCQNTTLLGVARILLISITARGFCARCAILS
jgi:hypothetical protein